MRHSPGGIAGQWHDTQPSRNHPIRLLLATKPMERANSHFVAREAFESGLDMVQLGRVHIWQIALDQCLRITYANACKAIGLSDSHHIA